MTISIHVPEELLPPPMCPDAPSARTHSRVTRSLVANLLTDMGMDNQRLLAEINAKARREGISLSEIIGRALRRELQESA